MTSQIAENLAEISQLIEQTCLATGRHSAEVKLLAVSKSQSHLAIIEACSANHWLFGENYVQEAQRKIQALHDALPTADRAAFHLIGPLQRNKVKKAVGLFETIETVANVELARAIAEEAQKKDIIQNILVQINVSGENSKSGISPDYSRELCEAILKFPTLRLCGLMCIGTYVSESVAEHDRGAEFRYMAQLRRELSQQLGYELRELSMGMSHDFTLAIREGATIVRIGSAIFGERT